MVHSVFRQVLPKIEQKWKRIAFITIFGVVGSLSGALISTNWTIKAIAKLDTPLGKQTRSLTRGFQEDILTQKPPEQK